MTDVAFKWRISESQAQSLVITLAKRGDHPYAARLKSVSDLEVRGFLADHGYNFYKVVDACRHYPRPAVPLFETGEGVPEQPDEVEMPQPSVIPQRGRGRLVGTGEGPGGIARTTYQGLFDLADRALLQTRNSLSGYQAFLAACSHGIGSLEAYLHYRAALWDPDQPEQALLYRPSEGPSLEYMIEVWVPRMTGRRLDLDQADLASYQRLRELQERQSEHSPTSAQGASLQEFAQRIDDFRGLAGILLQMHQHFDQQVPIQVIRAYFRPDTIVR